jgi:hypothetical protein
MSEARTDGRKSSKHPYETPKFRKVGPADIIWIGGLLERHLVRTPDDQIAKDADGAVSYEDGWDDARVAAEAIPDYPGRGVPVVGSLRVKLYGVLRRAAAPKAAEVDPGLLARVEVIEAWLRHLGADLNSFPPMHLVPTDVRLSQ